MTTPNDASDGETFKATTVESGIRQTAPKRWEVRVFAGRHPDTGAPRTVSRSTTKGIRDARRIKTQIAAEVARGEHGVRSGTVGSLLDAWITDGKQGRAERTLAAYRQKIDYAIRPALGSILLEKLTARGS